MTNKNRNLREHKMNFKNKTCNLQSNKLSNSVKYWSFTPLIMHYFVYGSLLFSLSNQTFALTLSFQSLCSSVSFALPDFWFAVLAQTSQMGGLFQQSIPIG